LNRQVSQPSQFSRKRKRETRPGNAEGKLPGGTPHPAFDAGRPCRTSQRNRCTMNTYVHRHRCAGIVTLHRKGALCRSRTAGQGDARNETARKKNTSASAFQAKGDLRLECRCLRGLVSDGASASALRRRDGKAVSHLLGFRIFAAPLPLPPQLFTAEYRVPEQLQGASSLRAVICRRLLASALPLSPSGCVNGNRETQRFSFPKPFGSSCSRRLCA